MKALVTGSSGHLGEALVRTLRKGGDEVTGLDVKASEFTNVTGSIADSGLVRESMDGAEVVFHCATLHKPHVATHSKQDFLRTNVEGTLVMLEAAVDAGVESFVFTSTTSLFGEAMRAPPDEPAVWVTEALAPVPRNIYGVSKLAAEGLCRLVHQQQDLNVLVLRTSRFFPEDDDDKATRNEFDGSNSKANELLFRRADIEDIVGAHLSAASRAPEIGHGVFIISATTPFHPEDLAELRRDAPAVLAKRVPAYEDIYRALDWRMFESIDRVYDNSLARKVLGWEPRHDFDSTLQSLNAGLEAGSGLAREVGAKGYHDQVFSDGPYPVE